MEYESLLSDKLYRTACEIETFEASASQANTGTGSRREGDRFEKLLRTLWDQLADCLGERGASHDYVHDGTALFRRLRVDTRTIYLPTSHVTAERTREPPSIGRQRSRWFDRDFRVTDIVRRFPGEPEAIARYAPTAGAYVANNYPDMYANRKTTFDDTIVLEDSGILKEKILLEYKTAKSSRGISIDGNAHERLSFQIMQYLEVATLYPRCSLTVIANGAFAFYKNKYHVNFHIQADRLANFAWFELNYLCTVREYSWFVCDLIKWLYRKE